jgi:acyl-coenzyme A synthetase/AMP-(fatty) acid ligase
MYQCPTQGIYKWSQEAPEAVAIVCGPLQFSYSQLAVSIAKFIKALEDLGVKKGMLIGLNYADDSRYRVLELIMVFSLDAIGAIRVSNLGDKDVNERCDFIFTNKPDSFSTQGKIKSLVFPITQEWVHTILDISNLDFNLDRLNCTQALDDPIFFGSTSGTTGNKKFLYDTASSMQSMFRHMENLFYQGPIRNFISVYGICFGASYVGVSIAFIKGGTVIFTGLDQYIENINNHIDSHSVMLMNDVNYLIKKSSHGLGGHKLTTLRVLGSHLPVDIRIWLQTYLAEKVVNSYSSNESGHMAEALANGQCRIYPDVQLRIVDEDWHDLPQGELGQVTVKSPMQISGYLWNPELNIQHFKDGWFRSNDIGYLTPEGNLVLVDRADNMLNLAGIKVAPAPIEAEIKLLPGVDDCVLLEEDTLSDLQTIAICIEASKKIDRALLEKAVIAVLAKRFKSYRFCFVKAFPRTETGKVKRKELQQQVLNRITHRN